MICVGIQELNKFISLDGKLSVLHAATHCKATKLTDTIGVNLSSTVEVCSSTEEYAG